MLGIVSEPRRLIRTEVFGSRSKYGAGKQIVLEVETFWRMRLVFYEIWSMRKRKVVRKGKEKGQSHWMS